MFLSNQDVVDLVSWRRKLHSRPEISGEESLTAREVQTFLSSTAPDCVVSGLGGEGVAVVYQGAEPGPTVMFRAELDALPIEELSGRPKSERVVLMFQPAEENGAGAAAVIADPKFADVAPDYVFALHNVPGKTAHASMLDTGTSPMSAVASLMPALTVPDPAARYRMTIRW
jgi:metal-dependent amidase/aminoacylase/carboxypeptidase family protein